MSVEREAEALLGALGVRFLFTLLTSLLFSLLFFSVI